MKLVAEEASGLLKLVAEEPSGLLKLVAEEPSRLLKLVATASGVPSVPSSDAKRAVCPREYEFCFRL